MNLKSTLFFLFALFFYSVSLYAQKKVYPLNGEGITLLLERYDCAGNGQYRRFVELNKNRLGPKNSLLKGVAYELPPKLSQKKTNPSSEEQKKEAITIVSSTSGKVGKVKSEPLFGPNFAQYKVESNELTGATFYLVCGHGGPDPGAIGKVGRFDLHEDEYAYDIILRLARNLMVRGAKVHIIIQDKKDGIRNDMYLSTSKRETCMGSPIPLNQLKRLQQRTDKINTLYSKNPKGHHRAVFIHLDSRSKSKQMDVFFYHAEGSRLGEKAAMRMRSLFRSKYEQHQPGRGFSGTVSGRNLYVLKNTKPAALFVELGNIQNQNDQKRFVQSSNRQALAKWLCEGLIKDYKEEQKRK